MTDTNEDGFYDHTVDKETHRIWFLDCIRRRSQKEFTKREIFLAAYDMFLWEDPSTFEQKSEAERTLARMFLITVTMLELEDLGLIVGIDDLKLVDKESWNSNRYRITEAGMKCCAEVMEASGLTGANDF